VREEDGLQGRSGFKVEGVFYTLLFCSERSIMACSSELSGKEVMGGGFLGRERRPRVAIKNQKEVDR